MKLRKYIRLRNSDACPVNAADNNAHYWPKFLAHLIIIVVYYFRNL